MEQTENVSPSSAKWVKPTDVLKLRKKLKPVVRHLVPNSCVLKPVDQNIIINRPKEAVFNPFRKVSQKRKIHLAENEISGSNGTPDDLHVHAKTDIIKELLDDNATFGFKSNENISVEDQTVSRCSVLPLDWSLKSKLRFISNKSFPWKGCLKASEESSGTTSFARCLHLEKHQECTVDTSANARFHQQCLVWIHPFLPWLDLFPRFGITRNSFSVFNNNQELQDSLHSAWCDSFRSVHQLVRARQCPYFYLCAATFTALFRSAGTAGFSDHHVLLTPTTKGFRQSLKEEGINFTMPLNSGQDLERFLNDGDDSHLSVSDGNSFIQDSENNAENVASENNHDEEEPVTWLESLGLSQNDFPTLNPKKRKIEPVNLDRKPQSLICIEGADTQAVVNFLLNSRWCIATTGSLAGVPPTILAPCAFHGATLQPLKVRQARINKEQTCIEITGPILPNALDGLCNLFNTTQDGNFVAMMKTLDTTEAFSLLQTSCNVNFPSIFATENLKDSGLCSTFLQQACKAPSHASRPFQEITAASGLFSWK